MGAHRATAKEEPLGDFSVGQSLGHQAQDLDLAVAEACRIARSRGLRARSI